MTAISPGSRSAPGVPRHHPNPPTPQGVAARILTHHPRPISSRAPFRHIHPAPRAARPRTGPNSTAQRQRPGHVAHCLSIPAGMTAISPGLSEATPPGTDEHRFPADPARGRSPNPRPQSASHRLIRPIRPMRRISPIRPISPTHRVARRLAPNRGTTRQPSGNALGTRCRRRPQCKAQRAVTVAQE